MSSLRLQSQLAQRRLSLSCQHQRPMSMTLPTHNPFFPANRIQSARKYATDASKPLVYLRPPGGPIPTTSRGQSPPSRSAAGSLENSKPLISVRWRMGLGTLFIGTLIYSMVHISIPVFPFPTPTSLTLLATPGPLTNDLGHQSDAIPRAGLEPPSIADRDTLAKRESGISPSSPMRLRMESFIKAQQKEIVETLESLDPSHKFRIDTWTRPNGGGGISCVLQDGQVFEKAGVNTSIVYGTLPRQAIEKMRVNHKELAKDVDSLEFFAAGLSCVLHPQNPNAPTVHFNYRYFETMDADGKCNAWWFGGGTDLTPTYLFDEDAVHFHRTIKDACDKHDPRYYDRFKQWCDRYFHIPHRHESRGIGGIFFDDLDRKENDPEQLFSFTQDCLLAFLPSYLPIIEKRKDMPFTLQEKEWQQLRRGRYVEFNLVIDRGTSFGLATPGARVESILMSLPLTARWQYMHEPGRGSREERLMSVLREPREWI